MRRNPRKRRAPRKPSRRSVPAQSAKSRRTTKGHRRKERPYAAAKGRTRKTKHKGRARYNPYLERTAFSESERDQIRRDVKTQARKTQRVLKQWRTQLQGAGKTKLPGDDQIVEMSQSYAEVVVAGKYPELRSVAQTDTPPQQLLVKLLPGFKRFFKDSKDFTDRMKVPLARARKKIRAGDKKVQKLTMLAKDEAAQQADEALLAKLKAREAAMFGGPGEDEGEGPDPETAAEIAGVYGEEAEEEQLAEVAQREKASKKRKKEIKRKDESEGYEPPVYAESQSGRDRKDRYGQYMLTTRRTDVRPTMEMLGEAREDVLLFVLQDGTTQMWMKGSLTETMTRSERTPSWIIAQRYANYWRGLGPSGNIRPDRKKSRGRSRVLIAIEPARDEKGKVIPGQETGYKVIHEAIDAMRPKGSPKGRQMPDFPLPKLGDKSTYERKGEWTNNPRKKRAKRRSDEERAYQRTLRRLAQHSHGLTPRQVEELYGRGQIKQWMKHGRRGPLYPGLKKESARKRRAEGREN